MQSIGERLEEARKRRGISVREASEATKIRGDYLLSFENNQFDVGLPEIYVRGFLRNYASFLKVDDAKIATDYNATLLGESKVGRKDARELFGRMELPDRTRQATEGTGAVAGPARPQVEEPDERSRSGITPEMVNYLKIGAIIVAGVVAILVIVLLIQKIITSGGSSTASPSSSPSAEESTAPLAAMTLIALDSVSVKVLQLSDNTVVFDGALARGETKPISVRGRARITYDRGANLQIEWNGQRYRMTVQDVGFSTFPP